MFPKPLAPSALFICVWPPFLHILRDVDLENGLANLKWLAHQYIAVFPKSLIKEISNQL
jgi:hypothetical protein